MNVRPALYLVLCPLLTLTAGAEDEGPHGMHVSWQQSPTVRIIREAVSRYRDPQRAVSDGYVPDPFCVSGNAAGAMGIHFINYDLLDAAVDLQQPEVLIYEPMPGGRLRLVGVEYLADRETWHAENGELALPTVGGHLFHLNGSPNRYNVPAFYELHVWAFKYNPSGAFTDWNPAVTCDAYVPAAP
jgi:hypothetical protein